jgi:hypothetical protein
MFESLLEPENGGENVVFLEKKLIFERKIAKTHRIQGVFGR